MSDILVKNGVSLDEIDAIIWSHFYFDHTGDPSLFPNSTDLVVGPDFIRNYTPGWPEGANSPVKSEDWKGRTLREVNFNGKDDGKKKLMVGAFSCGGLVWRWKFLLATYSWSHSRPSCGFSSSAKGFFCSYGSGRFQTVPLFLGYLINIGFCTPSWRVPTI